MMTCDLGRRSFLKGALGAAGVGGGLLHPWLRALASYPPCSPTTAVWGDLPAPPTGQPPIWAAPRDLKILEIHLYGGISPWETFYVRPPTSTDRYRGFTHEVDTAPWGTCDNLTDPEPAPFGTAGGAPVYWSRFTKPLWSSAILSKTRVVVLKHDLLPHEAAIPYAMTGLPLGRPNLAGLGAYIQHRANEFDLACGTSQGVPYSYVCWPSSFNFPFDNLQASAAIGTHPGSSRPLVLSVGADATAFINGLARPGITSQFNDLLNQYRGQYRDQLRSPHLANARTRSKGFDAYDYSAESLQSSSALRTLLQGSPLASPVRTDTPCPEYFMGTPHENIPGHAIRLAGYLLSQPGPRYICVIDGGLNAHPMGGGYDTHSSSHIDYTASNLWNVLRTLRELIDNGTITLANTLIVLTTEFGRTPTRNTDGRDHWPDGYVNVLIGGPVTRGISGAIQDGGAADGVAVSTDHYSPTDLRAAILVAAGINPFVNEGFNLRDVTVGGGTHYEACINLKQRVLGA